jgi:hypothetical protein
MDIKKLNDDQQFIDQMLLNEADMTEPRFINIAQYIQRAMMFKRVARNDENATEHDAETIARGKMIQDWLDAKYDLDAATYEAEIIIAPNLLRDYLNYCEYLLMENCF